MVIEASQLAALAAEIKNDPLTLGYAALSASRAEGPISALLNATTGKGASSVQMPSMARDDFLLAILPAVAALGAGINVNTGAALPSATVAKWDRFLDVIRAADSVQAGNAAILYNAGASGSNQPLLNQAVNDGLLTAAQATAVTQRLGSRAEELFGAGAVVDAIDVQKAMGW